MIRTRVGYTGGTTKNPTYRNLGDHTETVQLEYDPIATSYDRLLEMFWGFHDATACHKRQYMSAIFYHDKEQKQIAEDSFKKQQHEIGKTLATKILPARTFYDAEDYHQKYLLQRCADVCKGLRAAGVNLKTSHVAARLNGYCSGNGSKASFEAECTQLGLSDQLTEMVRRYVKQ